MSPKPIEPSSRTSRIDSCTLHLQQWRPFQTQDSISPTQHHHPHHPPSSSKSKRPCNSTRSTTSSSFAIETTLLDLSKLTLFDDPTTTTTTPSRTKGFFARKRRRKGSTSVSAVSSDRSGTRRRYCSVTGTCSDFVMAVGTDSSGELFVNGDGHWSSDVSEAARNGRREKYGGVRGAGAMEKENVVPGFGSLGSFDAQGNESGYGSEPGYRGDAEFGDGDEFDEEEDCPKPFFWDHQLAGNVANPKRATENTLQKTHHRGRRKKHDLRMVDPIG